jgi:hypothetical protein
MDVLREYRTDFIPLDVSQDAEFWIRELGDIDCDKSITAGRMAFA